MDGVEEFPFALRLKSLASRKILRGGLKAVVQFLHEFSERADFVQELSFSGEENLAEEIIETGRTLASGILKIPGTERGEIGSGSKMLGMFQHGSKQRLKRMGEPLAKRRSHAEDLVCLRDTAVATQPERLVQIHAEHCVSRFKSTDKV